MRHVYWVLKVLLLLTFLGCSQSDPDPCDVEHTIINGECVPNYIFPVNRILNNGDKFYHHKYGVIIYVNGNWFDASAHIIEDLEIKLDQ